jgi:hypothetical protein
MNKLHSESKPMNEEKKTAEDYFKERFDLVYWDDKFDRKCQRFDFYDMVDFADQYASQFKSVPPLPVEDKEEHFTRRDIEIAFCTGLLNQHEVTTDSLEEQLKTARDKIEKLIEFIRVLKVSPVNS